MIIETKISEKLQQAFENGGSVKEMLMNPEIFAEKYGIEDKDSFVSGVTEASSYVPEETYHLFANNPFVKDDTRKLFKNLETTDFDNSKTLPVTVATLVLALTAAVVAAKLVTK